MRRRMIMMTSLLTLAGTAHADEVVLAHGYALDVQLSDLAIVNGKRRAPLITGIGLQVRKLAIDAKAGRATFEILDNCDHPTPYAFTFDELEARLVNAEALTRHRAKKWPEAAVGFGKAVALAPAWKLPALNLASAQQLMKHPDDALATLAPWLQRDPIATYLEVASDPELAPLLASLASIEAATPGTASLSRKRATPDLVVAPGLVAVTRIEASWGGGGFEQWLEIYDATTGAQLARQPIIKFEDVDFDGNLKSKSSVEARVVQLETALRRLGFSAPAHAELGSEPIGERGDKQTSRFAKGKLGVVALDGTVRMLRKDTELGTGHALDRLTQATLLDADVVLWTTRPGREGCEGTNPTLVTVIPVTP